MMETWVDSHVHFYPCFTLRNFLEAARRNLIASRGVHSLAVLVLTETVERRHPLAIVRSRAGNVGDGWTCVDLPHDPDVTLCYLHGVPRLLLIPGRQLVSSEGLELLALCTTNPICGSRPLEAMLYDINEAGGVATIPWGFGKWWFHRGQLLEQLLLDVGSIPLLLGDNGGRPQRSRRSRLFLQAEAIGIPVIAGSDPLPLPGQECRVGSYGSVLPGTIDLNCPQWWLREQLLRLDRSPQTFGACRRTSNFVADQLRLRLATR